jgi:hypothetical protein
MSLIDPVDPLKLNIILKSKDKHGFKIIFYFESNLPLLMSSLKRLPLAVVTYAKLPQLESSICLKAVLSNFKSSSMSLTGWLLLALKSYNLI